MLGVISRPFAVEPSHAQDNSYSLPLEVWGYVEYATWSLDSTQFTFTTDYDYRTNPPAWYTYSVEAGLVLTSNLYPIPVQLADVNKAALQISDYVLNRGDFAISPNGLYMAYDSTQQGEYGSLFGIANLQTSEFAILDVQLFTDIRIEWSADETALIVDSMGPYGARTPYLVQNIEPSLTTVESIHIGVLGDYVIINWFDISSDAKLLLTYGWRDDTGYLVAWNSANPDQLSVISPTNKLIDAQFSISRPNTILAVMGSDLVEYDISGDPIEISRHPLGISDVVSAYFSPDQSYLALVSKSDHDGYHIVNIVKLPNDHQP